MEGTPTMRFTKMKMVAVSATASSLLGFAAVPAQADETYNPQTTVDGCSLQGGCPTNAGIPGEEATSAESSVSPAQQGALDWMRAQLGSSDYYGLCLRLVVDAFAQGGGVDIGSAPSALEYWQAHPELQHPGDINPPAGALVFWDATASNRYGHVGIAEGGDSVISSYERSDSTVHQFSIADRNTTHPYLGWMVVA